MLRIHADQPEWITRHMPEIGERGSDSRITDVGGGIVDVHVPSGEQADVLVLAALVLAALVARRAARVTRSRWEGLEVA